MKTIRPWYSMVALGLAGLGALLFNPGLGALMLALAGIGLVLRLTMSYLENRRVHANIVGAIIWLGLAIPAATYLLYATATAGGINQEDRPLVGIAAIAATGGGILGIVSLFLWLRKRSQAKKTSDQRRSAETEP